MRVSRHVVTTL